MNEIGGAEVNERVLRSARCYKCVEEEKPERGAKSF
jgi:hypothetical protein